jgi:hypothetical protein
MLERVVGGLSGITAGEAASVRGSLSNGSRSGDNACVKMSVIQKSDQVYPPGRDH